ncbi:hypothetical protein V6N13_057412 [Hibiscus sabdariffa]
MSNPPGMVGQRAMKRMSGAANGSTTKFPISVGGGVLVTPTRPTNRGFGHVVARSRWLRATCLDIVTPNTGRPCVATVLGGVSRPSNVHASDLIKSQWRLWCALTHCFLRSSTESIGRVGCEPVGVDAAACTQWVVCLGPCGTDVGKECYLVDPASSHMLVSKIKPCMFKKLVVGPRIGSAGPPHGEHWSARPYCQRCAPGLNWPGRSSGAVTLKKLECSKQAYACIH